MYLFQAPFSRRVARSTVTILLLSIFSFGLPNFSLLAPATAATVTTGNCQIEGTNTSNFTVIDSTTADGTCMVRFTTSTSSITVPTEVNSIRTLAVGGGGGGGFGGIGGGGGAGSVIYSTTGITGMSGVSITATIGDGGASPISKTNPTDQATWGQGAQGSSTTLNIAGTTFTANGGGGGGGSGNTDKRTSGTSGGSGGGSAVGGTSAGSGVNTDYALWTEAVNGGYKTAASTGGGGGGAGGAATNANGAIGVAVLGYSVGGGGAGWQSGTNTASAPYGGGAPRGGGSFPCTNDTCHGSANTGGGGGGGGDGGSGVALVKYVPVRGQGAISATRTTYVGRTHTFGFTATNAASTGITRSYQWQVQLAGSSTWSNVTGGTGATTTSYTTKSLTAADSANSYRMAVTDTNATLGISTTTYTSVAGATLVNLTTDYALSFTGTNQFAQAADNSAFDLTASFSFEAWVYPTDVSVYKMVANKENSYMFYIANGYWTLSLDGPSTTWSIASNNVPAIANEWHHIAITKLNSSANYTFYYDGQVAYTGAADTLGTATAVNTTDPFTVGSRTAYTDHFFKGMIDNVAGFSTVRNQTQIQSDMNNYIAGDTTGLLYYYDFNEGSGSTAFNHAATGTSATDLTITGASYQDVKSVDNSSAHTKITFNRTYITPIGGWQSPNSQLTYTSLVVAGGGAGGARVSTGAGGGGGAGGMVESAVRTVDSNTVLGIRVGQGGLGVRTGTMSTIATGDNGQNSILQYGSTASPLYVTAIGGGGGAGGYGSQGDASYNGSAGGSGGGASGSNISGYSGGAAQQTSSGLDTGYGNAGGGNPGCSNNRPGGGGGGAGGVGELSTVCTQSGKGGDGRTSSVTGSIYAGGGGAGNSGDNGGATVTPGAGGSGGGATGGAGNLIGSSSELLGNAGTAGTGGGGGGVGISSGIIRGGAGGSGVIVIKLLTTSIPVYTGPFNDTTTAGLTYTFTVDGNPPAAMIRSYRWQSSTDTGTSWSNISNGSGFTTASYTTPILETTTSGARYQYRVIVTDTETGTTLSDTSTGVYLMINARISMSGSYTIYKYGVTHADTFTVATNTGTGNKTIKRTSTEKSKITWDTSTANIARVTVDATLAAGTYYDTLTVTDEESATLVFPVTVKVLKADTATVTVASRTDTYTASSLSYTDSFTVTGLVAGDSLTSISYSFSGTANDGTAFNAAARPAIAGTYSIIPAFTLANASSYESITVVNGTLTINRKLRTATIGTQPTSLKYGDTSTVTATASEGGSDGTLSFTSSTGTLCTISGSVLQALEASGTCSYTATIGRGNNYETATSLAATTTLALADTLTVTVLPITSRTYTTTQAQVSPQVSIAGLKLTDTATATSVTFSYNSATEPTSFTTVKPTLTDTYTVKSETLTLTSGLLSRYQGVVYVAGSFRINRAQQSPLVIPQYVATYGETYTAIIFGGSGTGLYSETVSAGSASGCTINGHFITTSTQGTCILSATKAGDRNYETATVSGEIYFLLWRVNPSPATIGSGSVIALNAEVSITRNSNTAPAISSVASSGDFTYPIAITGAGFASSPQSSMVLKFWRNKVVPSADYVVKSDTLIWSKQPFGVTTGKVLITNEFGSATSVYNFSPLSFTI